MEEVHMTPQEYADAFVEQRCIPADKKLAGICFICESNVLECPNLQECVGGLPEASKSLISTS
jgi:hypothetical protein